MVEVFDTAVMDYDGEVLVLDGLVRDGLDGWEVRELH
jgi:hypothetical protein